MFRKPMKMRDLEIWGVPSFMVDIWEENYSPFLLPVQEEAVREYGILNYLDYEKDRKDRKQHLVVVAPTSSGKTFIGEMAAITQAIHHKKTFYLVPLRSLAEEKYEHFKRLYASPDCKFKVRVSSRDRREDDKKIIKGDYQIAIMVYEKFNYFLLKYPLLLKGVSLIVIDEMQLINDPIRGPLLEEMIKHIRKEYPQIKLIGLSAYLENKAEFLNWFQAAHLLSYQRPVELRKGIVRRGIFRYITHNLEEYGKEEFFNLKEDQDISYEDSLVHTLSYFIQKDEPTLLFFPTRKETRRWTTWLAEKIDAPRAEGAISELSRMEETSSRDELLFLLEKGIAYHNADLSWEERKLIEDYLKAGEIKLICATTTLAMGVNLPFKNVILSVNKYITEDGDYQKGYLINLSPTDVENMGGRAGRFNQGKQEFGRVIFLADSPFSETVLQNLYFNFKSIKEDKKAGKEMINEEGETYDPPLKSKSIQFLRPKKNEKDFITFVLKAIVAGNDSQDKLYNYIQEITTTSEAKSHNYWVFDFEKEDLEQETVKAIEKLRQENLICPDFSPTPEGVLICAKGISISTYLYFKKYLERKTGRCSELEIITLLTLSEEGKRLFLPSFHFNFPLKRDSKNKLEYRYPENIPLPALLLYDWIGEKEIKEIEKEYKIYSGMIQRLGEGFSWLADALCGVAESLGWKQEDLAKIEILADRLAWGVQEEGLKLARLHIPGLTRSYIRRLVKEGYNDKQCLAQLSEEILSRLVPKRLARRIKRRLSGEDSKIDHKMKDNSAASSRLPHKSQSKGEFLLNTNNRQSTTILEVDRNRPDRIIFMGKKVETTATEFSLLYLLAQYPERVISYEEILNEIWQEEEDAIYNRVSFHLSKIRKNIFKVMGKTRRRIDQERLKYIFSVVPGRGIMLRLTAQKIKII